MTRAKYPLDPLAKLRDQRAQDQAEDLARRTREREAAEASRVAADEERRRARENAETRRRAEGEALARGELRVADLARADAWEHRVAADDATLRERVARAAEDEACAIDAESEARAELARRKVDADVVHEHKERFEARVKREAEAKEAEAAEEAWRRR